MNYNILPCYLFCYKIYERKVFKINALNICKDIAKDFALDKLIFVFIEYQKLPKII